MSHYFEAPTGPERRRTIGVRLFDTEVELQTADGVFSAGGLDPGTAVLLRAAPAPSGEAARRRLLDLGCGYGPIALALALACPLAAIDAVDVNPRALALTRDNARALGVGDRVSAFLPDDVPDDRRYGEIWSNPPIRIGKIALHELLLRWLPRLEPGGVARLVVGRNLGADSLREWLIGQGFPTVRSASSKGFRVLCVSPTG